MVGHLPGNVLKSQVVPSSQMAPMLVHEGSTVRKIRKNSEPVLITKCKIKGKNEAFLFAGDVMTSFNRVVIPAQGNWFQTKTHQW